MGIHYSLPFSFYSLQLYSLKQQTVLKKLGQQSLLQTILIYFLVSKNYSRYIYQQFSQRTYHRKKSTTCSLTILLRHYNMVIKYFIVSISGIAWNRKHTFSNPLFSQERGKNKTSKTNSFVSALLRDTAKSYNSMPC